MLTYYLDGQPIDAPGNLDGLTLRKSRHRTYWGFLYRKLGYVEGIGNLLFQQPSAVDYLRAEFASRGVQAETTFRIDDGGRVLYDGFIDYATWSYDGFVLSLGLRDNRAVADLEAGAVTVYGLPATGALQLPARQLGGTPTLRINPAMATVQQASINDLSVAHYVPLKRLSDTVNLPNGTVTDVLNPISNGTIYRNDTGKTQLVTVSGVVVAAANANSTVAISLKVTTGTDSVDVFTGSLSTAPVTLTAVVNVTLSVTPGGTLGLLWAGDSRPTVYKFVYDPAATSISLSDEATVPESAAYGLPVSTAMAALIGLTTGGKLNLQSNWLTNGDGASLFLTRGAGIRGIVGPVQVSVQGLFVALNRIFNLALWVEGNTVYLEPKAGQPRRYSFVGSLTARTSRVATDYLYNAVNVGYAVWKADSILSGDEVNAQQGYTGGITAIRNTLDLVSELITSSNLIEQQRRLQFDPKTAGAATAANLDNSLFLICTDASRLKAETRERTDYLTGVHDPDTVMNTRISPARNLGRWADWLAASGPLSRQTSQGNGGAVSRYDGQTVPDLTTLIPAPTPMLVTLEGLMTLDAYENLGDTIEYDGGEGELLDAEWRKTQTGSTATLTLLQR